MIRVESIYRFDPESLPVENVPLVAREMWRGRFMSLIPDAGRVVVIPFDQIRARIVQSVKAGHLKPSQGERLRLFLELETTGEAEGFHGPKQFAERRREARKHGLRGEDAKRPELDFELEGILASYDVAPAWESCSEEPDIAAAA